MLMEKFQTWDNKFVILLCISELLCNLKLQYLLAYSLKTLVWEIMNRAHMSSLLFLEHVFIVYLFHNVLFSTENIIIYFISDIWFIYSHDVKSSIYQQLLYQWNASYESNLWHSYTMMSVTQASWTTKRCLASLPAQADFSEGINQTTQHVLALPGQAFLQINTGNSQAGE